ncbi:MAG: beta strand repeat-containing protein, partial [Chthoniobacteraceae bacterium]
MNSPSRTWNRLSARHSTLRVHCRPSPLAKAISILLTGAAVIPTSRAADGTWTQLLDGLATGLWSDTSSWQGGIIADGAGFTADFSTLDVTFDSEIHLDSPRTLETLIFGDADPLTPVNWTLANNFDPANVLTLSGDAPTIRANGGAGTTLTINTVIAGTEGLTYDGSSTIRMAGNVGHTYTGGTTLKGRVETTNVANAPLTIFGAAVADNALTFDGGYLRIFNTTASTSAGSLLNDLIVDTTGTLEYSGRSFTSGTLTGSGVLNVITHYVRADNGGNWSNFAGTINVTSGDAGVSDFRQTTYNGFAAATLNLGENSNLYFTPNQANNQNPYAGTAVDIGALSGVASATLRGGPISNRVTSFRIGAKGIDSEFAGRIIEATTGALTNVIKNGPGILTLSGVQSGYNGPTRINEGVLAVAEINNGGAVSSIGQSSNVASNLLIDGGTLRYIGSGNSSDRLFSIGVAGGTIDASGSGALNFTNTGVLGLSGGVERTLILTGSNTGANTISATIPDDVGQTYLTKQGAGTWVLNGQNTYSGITNIHGGVLSVRSLANGGLPSGIGQSDSGPGNLILDGGTLRFTGDATTTDRSFTIGAGGATLDASGAGALTFSSTGPLEFTTADQARTLTLTGSNTGNNTLSAPLTNNGTGVTSLTKTGSGTWAITGPSTYTGGTTVSGGTLKVNNATGSGTGAGAVSVNAGGALGGFGTISGSVTVSAGGHILPGDGVGTLTVGNLSLSTGAVLDYEFTLASGNDLVAVTLPNGLTLNDVGFNLFTAGSSTRWTNP